MLPIKNPLLYSCINIAKLNSPVLVGLSHVNVPVLGFIETPSGKEYPGMGSPLKPFASIIEKTKLSPSSSKAEGLC